jgi:Asp-tRNA(Asn)/Glu-tRNA(Gln) amidotransferase A subunit family amidase
VITRREVIALLTASGVGTLAFQRALAVEAAKGGLITRQMIADAEWVAGIELSDEQRRLVEDALRENKESLQNLRSMKLDYDLSPALLFAPYSSPDSSPDPRGYRQVEADTSSGPASDRPTSDEELAFLPLRKLGALLRSRQISSTELTKLYLDRLHRYDPLLKCVVTFTDDLALKQAQQADEELGRGHDRGPLHGIPWGAKDLLAMPGYPTTWGAPQYRDRVIDKKATVIKRLEEAGAVLIAKLATGAFAGEDFWWSGQTRNPWNPHQSASASSSGPASATAAALVGFSLASETMGSIVFPCARCGAVGLRPTFGRVSRHGCMPLGWSLDKIGPVCRSADDCGLVLGAIHGSDLKDLSSVDRPYVWPSSRELATIRVGYVEGDDQQDVQVFRDLGMQLIPVEFPTLPGDIPVSISQLEGTLSVESAAIFEDLTVRNEPKGVKMWPRVWAFGHFLSGVDYLKYCRVRTLLMKRTDELLQTVDVVLGDDGRTITNLMGHPKIVLPRAFKSDNGFEVPQPQMFFGRLYDESTLLTVASAYQNAMAMHSRRPALEQFLAEKDKFLEGEEFPDTSKLYE